MPAEQSMDARRQRLEAQESRGAISDLLLRYAFNIRKGTPANCAELFTGDAVFEMREANAITPTAYITNRKLIGRTAISDYIGMTGKPDFRIYPLIYNVLIELNGREAQSTAMMTAQAFPGGAILLGEYHDSFRYEERWLFSSRVHTIFRDGNPGAS